MIKFCGPRGNGKTEKLLKYAVENHCSILCENKRSMRYKASHLGYMDLEIYDLIDLLAGNIENKNVVIDNLDEVINELFHDHNVNVCGFIMTTEEGE